MMTINFDTITNNYEVIYVIITVMKYYLKKIDTSIVLIKFSLLNRTTLTFVLKLSPLQVAKFDVCAPFAIQ
jgi:hypothetical protein